MMGSFLTKAWSAFAVAVVSASALQADVAQPASSSSTSSCESVQPSYGYAYNPGLVVSDCCGWSAEIDFLYWKPNQEGVSFGSQADVSSGNSGVRASELISTSAASFKSVQKYPKFEWDSGFRFGLGYRFPADSWDLSLVFTHYKTDDSSSNSAMSNGGEGGFVGGMFFPAYSVYPLGPSSEGLDFRKLEGNLASDVGVDWRIHFNQVDLDLSREFFVGRQVTLKPYIGARTLFIEEKYDIRMTQSSNGYSPGSSIKRENINQKNHFKGVGVLAGFGSTYSFDCGLAVYGDVAWSTTFGQFEVHQNSSASVVSVLSGEPKAALDTTTNAINLSKDGTHDSLLTALDLAFGIRWRQPLNWDKNIFTLKLGWESHSFFNFNKFRSLVPGADSLTNNSPTGTLSFYGVVFAAGIDF